jgi:hypothetical protein
MVSHFFFRYWDTRFQVLRYFVSVFQIRLFTTLSTPPITKYNKQHQLRHDRATLSFYH